MTLDACCGPILAGAPAPTAEALMRSRYSAYVLRNYAHLHRSLDAAQRADYSETNSREWAESARWQGLEVRGTEAGGPDDAEGTVDFVAKFHMQGQDRVHVERARFTREDGRWVYSGEVKPEGGPAPIRREAPKVGRNDPCTCGSGKKYKKCCGKE
jgi:SEC-C motif domain protein